MKVKKLIIFILLIYSCGYIGAGSLGAYQMIVFPKTQSQISLALDSFYSEYPQFTVPAKWKYESDYWKRDKYNTLKGFIFYFNDKRKEMYYVTYAKSGFGVANPEYTRIAIAAVYQGAGWKEIKKYSDDEKNRIEKRFEKEIITKLEKLTGTKSFYEETYP